MKKKHLVLGVTILSIFALTGCGSKEEAVVEGPAEVIEATIEEAEENEKVIVDEEAGDSEIEEVEAVVEEVESEEIVIDRTKAFELISNINIGWNLGNTMDAWGVGNSVDAETCWSNPKTSQELIDCVRDAGFNAIRIPVTWGEHIGSAPEYKIDDAWMARVKEIVDYAVNDDMYILLDTHHEEDHWLTVDPDNQEALVAETAALWAQISEEFKDYDEKLIFEGLNEPRCKGSSAEWNGGTPAERVVVNAMNKAFVDTVRASGGNNSERLLVICPYGNSPGNKALAELEIPEDNNIAVAVHMYTPYTFTYIPEDGSSVEVWDGSMKSNIVNTIKQLDMYFLSKDVPVLITEFGAQNKGNQAEIVKWLNDYLGSMNRYGIKCFWWDNGFYPNDGKDGNEYFAILNRETLEWYDPEIVDALVNQEK